MPSLVQIYPSRVTITPQRLNRQYKLPDYSPPNSTYSKIQQKTYKENFTVIKNPFVISKATKRKMMDSINSMYLLSKPRTITMKTGKQIFNYQMSFITLTLPSTQKHSDVELKKKCLNQFLVELRKHYHIENYIWKAEIQGNDNLHFHLLLDKYVDFQALRRRWNRILNKLNYVDNYQAKFKNMSLSKYFEYRNRKYKVSFEDCKKSFAAGQKSNWRNPNTVDVRSVTNKKSFAVYLAKYITKNPIKVSESETPNPRHLTFGRSWYRSYSLSTLQYKNKFDYSDVAGLIKYFKNSKESVLQFTGEFFTVFYFNINDLSKKVSTFIEKFIFLNASFYEYPLPYT